MSSAGDPATPSRWSGGSDAVIAGAGSGSDGPLDSHLPDVLRAVGELDDHVDSFVMVADLLCQIPGHEERVVHLAERLSPEQVRYPEDGTIGALHVDDISGHHGS